MMMLPLFLGLLTFLQFPFELRAERCDTPIDDSDIAECSIDGAMLICDFTNSECEAQIVNMNVKNVTELHIIKAKAVRLNPCANPYKKIVINDSKEISTKNNKLENPCPVSVQLFNSQATNIYASATHFKAENSHIQQLNLPLTEEFDILSSRVDFLNAVIYNRPTKIDSSNIGTMSLSVKKDSFLTIENSTIGAIYRFNVSLNPNKPGPFISRSTINDILPEGIVLYAGTLEIKHSALKSFHPRSIGVMGGILKLHNCTYNNLQKQSLHMKPGGKLFLRRYNAEGNYDIEIKFHSSENSSFAPFSEISFTRRSNNLIIFALGGVLCLILIAAITAYVVLQVCMRKKNRKQFRSDCEINLENCQNSLKSSERGKNFNYITLPKPKKALKPIIQKEYDQGPTEEDNLETANKHPPYKFLRAFGHKNQAGNASVENLSDYVETDVEPGCLQDYKDVKILSSPPPPPVLYRDDQKKQSEFDQDDYTDIDDGSSNPNSTVKKKMTMFSALQAPKRNINQQHQQPKLPVKPKPSSRNAQKKQSKSDQDDYTDIDGGPSSPNSTVKENMTMLNALQTPKQSINQQHQQPKLPVKPKPPSCLSTIWNKHLPGGPPQISMKAVKLPGSPVTPPDKKAENVDFSDADEENMYDEISP